MSLIANSTSTTPAATSDDYFVVTPADNLRYSLEDKDWFPIGVTITAWIVFIFHLFYARQRDYKRHKKTAVALSRRNTIVFENPKAEAESTPVVEEIPTKNENYSTFQVEPPASTRT